MFLSTAKKITLVLGIGLILTVFTIILINQVYSTQLIQRAKSFSLAVNATDLEKLKLKTLADDQVPYAQVKDTLAKLKAIYPETRFVYAMDRTPEGIQFLADSEAVNSAGYSARNSAYPEASDKLKAIFDNKTAYVEGPDGDSYGVWFSALAPVLDSSGNVTAVIGLDVPVTSYVATTIGLGLTPLIVAVIVSIAIRLYDNIRKRRRQVAQLQVALASVASHELGAPLRGIRWGEESLLKDKDQLSESHQKLVKVMYDSTLNLQKSVEDILQLSSMADDESKQPPAVPVEFGHIVQEAIASQELPAQEKKIMLVPDPSWPDVYTLADATRLRSAFIGLIAVAIGDAQESGRLTFSYSLKDERHIITVKAEGARLNEPELMLPRAILERYGGELQTETEGDMQIARVYLPVVTAPASDTATSAAL